MLAGPKAPRWQGAVLEVGLGPFLHKDFLSPRQVINPPPPAPDH